MKNAGAFSPPLSSALADTAIITKKLAIEKTSVTVPNLKPALDQRIGQATLILESGLFLAISRILGGPEMPLINGN